MVSPDLSIVIPTYNERKNIEILIPKIESSLKKHKVKAEIIIVDDNSPDQTGNAAISLNKKYKNIVTAIRKDKKGIASAWFHGYTLAKGKYVATMDADLCHDPEDLMSMYKELPAVDIVIGSRYVKGGSGMKDKGPIEIFASKIAQIMTRLIVGMKGYDLTHSFRIFKHEVFNNVKNKLRSQGNVFLVEFLYHANKLGYSIKEIPITYGVRKYGKTKLNVYIEGLRFFASAFRMFLTDKLRLRKG